MKKVCSSAALLALCAVQTTFGATSITQYGITWQFSADRTIGQYANGDYWVVGPVTITNILPASIVDGTGRTINGSQLNPELGDVQGYDSAPGDMTYDAARNVGRPGGDALSAANPLTISTGSLISSVSVAALQPRPQLKTAAILTVVASAPPEGAFRPPPVGSDKTSYWNKTNLNYSVLQSLAPPAGIPALATVQSRFEKPWLEQNPNWTARYIHPEDNQPAYGRDMAHALAEGLLSLHLDYSNSQKETLFIRLVQYGIDVYGTAKEGGRWEDLGGHNQGRKMPMLLAGLALNSTNILEYADASKHFIFQEDRQIWYVVQSDVGRVLYTGDGRPREQYIQADVGVPEWGEQHTRAPNRDGRNWDAYYRNICYSGEMGHALAAHLTPGAAECWNWPAFFDYMDRAFSIDGANASSDANTIQPYVAEMWNAYRNQSTMVPPVASFNASPTSGTVPLSVAFTDTSTGDITNRFWDFGDGTTTNTLLTSLGHDYAIAGIYSVALTVSGPAGSSTNTQIDLISATAPAVSGGDLVKLNISAAFDYDAFVTGEEISYASTQSKTVANTIGDNAVTYGRPTTQYSHLVDPNASSLKGIAADGVVAGGKYELAKGLTIKFGTVTGDTKVNNSVAAQYDNLSLAFSRTITLAASDQKKYGAFNILVNGNRYATLAGTMSATLSVKYVGDAAWYPVWTESVSSGNGGCFGGGYNGDTGANSKQSAAWSPVTVSDALGFAKTVNSLTVGGGGSSYMYEFATPVALDSTKVLESFKMDTTTYNKSRANEFFLYAASATLASAAPGGTDDDNDGLPNDWETQYFGGATNANPNALAANGRNTIGEAYIAGLDPTNAQSVFAVSNDWNILRWNATSGRVYSVYGTTNLLNGFQPLETNILWPQSSWTNLYSGEAFHRISVELKP